MLVLTRGIDEKIDIGNDVVVTIVEVRGNRVRVGIDAPPSVAVDRREVRLAKEREEGDCQGK